MTIVLCCSLKPLRQLGTKEYAHNFIQDLLCSPYINHVRLESIPEELHVSIFL